MPNPESAARSCWIGQLKALPREWPTCVTLVSSFGLQKSILWQAIQSMSKLFILYAYLKMRLFQVEVSVTLHLSYLRKHQVTSLVHPF